MPAILADLDRTLPGGLGGWNGDSLLGYKKGSEPMIHCPLIER
jgi:hypothetical protein